ncbi:MAG: circularly permuted type 2 ATP-grasp protein, partial [Pirellulales bacterium]|nr:circularly permuted type 2 ATP-grasp protein [Pirellulales bacterium]
YLGFPLVEGADLTVRDDRVYLKTLNGLRQVDLIFRRVDSNFSDPLELQPESLLGVAGLVAAIRAGNVVVANSLGSGLLECEALMSFLPGLSQRLLGEELQIPSVATWWCGQARERQHVLDNLDNLVIRPTFSSRSVLTGDAGAVMTDVLSTGERQRLIERIQRRGHDFIAQEQLSLSTAPVLRDGSLHPAPLALRIFLAECDGTYIVMPGALARTSDNVETKAISMQQGDASKDTWILWDEPVSTFSRLTPAGHRIKLRRSGRYLPSRVADNLFWLGRYAERAEATARLMRSLLQRLTGETGAGDNDETLGQLLSIMVDLGYLGKRVARQVASRRRGSIQTQVATLLFDPQSPLGLLHVVGELRRTASLARERLGSDAWLILNTLHAIASRYAGFKRSEAGYASSRLNELIQE